MNTTIFVYNGYLGVLGGSDTRVDNNRNVCECPISSIDISPDAYDFLANLKRTSEPSIIRCSGNVFGWIGTDMKNVFTSSTTVQNNFNHSLLKDRINGRVQVPQDFKNMYG